MISTCVFLLLFISGLEKHGKGVFVWVAGRRVPIYTALFFLGMVGRAVGPLMAAVVFMVSFPARNPPKAQ